MAQPLRVYFSATPGRSHNLYNEFFEAPPEGVTYLFPSEGEVGYTPPARGDANLLGRLRSSSFVRRAYTPILRDVLGGVGVEERLRRLRGGKPDWDVYHSTGGIHAAPDPWIVSLESSLDFFGLGRSWHEEIGQAGPRRYVRRKLLSRHCRRIVPWTEAARRSVLGTFPEDAAALDAKMEVVPLAIRAGDEPPPRRTDGPVKLLFVGSKNFPQDFLPKGGNLALAAFAKLRERHDVELTVRALMPESYRARYEGTEGLRILDGLLSPDELTRLYTDADIFLFPSCHTPGMVILEAMRAGLPSVMLDVWGNREILSDGESGLLVAPQENVPYLNRYMAPRWNGGPEFTAALERGTERVVADLVDRLAQLVDDPGMRRRMGARARQEIVSGRLSIARRNAALRRIYDDAAT